jgi:LuxR family transcriptional regulator, positive regulator of biofilm formation
VGGKPALSEKAIHILCPSRVQNDLLSRFLEQEIGLPCVGWRNPEDVPAVVDMMARQNSVLLWDCMERSADVCISELDEIGDPLCRHYLVVFFNVDSASHIEDPAMARGVKGFFYSQDPLEIFPRGINAVFEGELWVSREILTKSFLKNREPERMPPKQPNPLTPRETEILALISAGAKNEDIAEKLFISPNTVKTHIYNIFKKIHVPNRLQAALWAVKHL